MENKKGAVYLMKIGAKILNKILENKSQQYIKWILSHTFIGITMMYKGSLIRKTINLIYYFYR